MSPTRGLMMMGAMVVAVTLSALAAEPPKPTEPTPPASSDPGILSGPTVDEQAANQPGGGMGEERRRAAARNEIPQRMWMGVLRELNLNEEQQDAVRVIMDEFAADQRKFMAGLSDEDRNLIEQMNGRRPNAGEAPERNREQREKLAALEQQRPKIEPYQQRIWQELTPDQQAQMKEKLDAIRQRMAEAAQQRRGDERMKPADGSREPMMAPVDPATMPAATNTAGEDAPQRRRATRQAEAGQLDRLAQRRMRFLMSLTAEGAANGPRHIDGEPTPRDRDFQFNEDGTAPMNENPDR